MNDLFHKCWINFLNEARVHDLLCKGHVPSRLRALSTTAANAATVTGEKGTSKEHATSPEEVQTAQNIITKWDPKGNCCKIYLQTKEISPDCQPKTSSEKSPSSEPAPEPAPEKKTPPAKLSGEIHTGKCFSSLRHDKTYQWAVKYLQMRGYLKSRVNYLTPTYDPTKQCPVEVYNAATKYQNDYKPYKFTDLKDNRQADGIIGWRTINHMKKLEAKASSRSIASSETGSTGERRKKTTIIKTLDISKSTGMNPSGTSIPRTRCCKPRHYDILEKTYGKFRPFRREGPESRRVISKSGFKDKYITTITLSNGRRTPIHKAIASEAKEIFRVATEVSGYTPSTFWAYNPRTMTTKPDSSLSFHSYGIAFDVDSKIHPRSKGIKGPLVETPEGRKWAQHWVEAGWTWGIQFSNPDVMHFERTNRGMTGKAGWKMIMDKYLRQFITNV